MLIECSANPYRDYRFPEEIISQRVWGYINFCVSLRDVELMMAFRGVAVELRNDPALVRQVRQTVR